MLGILVNLFGLIVFLFVLTHVCDSKFEKAWIGLIVAMFAFNVGGELSSKIQEPYTNQSAIEECQKDLPRSQKCVLIAIPEQITGE